MHVMVFTESYVALFDIKSQPFRHIMLDILA